MIFKPSLLPTRLRAGALALAAGNSHTCAVLTGGAVYCWGYNFDGLLGTGDTSDRNTPTAVTGLGAGGSRAMKRLKSGVTDTRELPGVNLCCSLGLVVTGLSI
jgi:alpha-tubulin suppressor-like RCC1 family protein